jgi:hypothetical protein
MRTALPPFGVGNQKKFESVKEGVSSQETIKNNSLKIYRVKNLSE